MMFAGLWNGWRGCEGEILRTHAIITCVANATMT
jgi:putative SOS response-associated peptidase YedK